MAVSLLRDDPATAALTVRDLYDARTAAGLAARARPAERRQPAPPVVRRGRPILATLIQTLWLLAGLFVLGPLLYLLAFHAVPDAVGRLGFASFVLAAPLLAYAAGAL